MGGSHELLRSLMDISYGATTQWSTATTTIHTYYVVAVYKHNKSSVHIPSVRTQLINGGRQRSVPETDGPYGEHERPPNEAMNIKCKQALSVCIYRTIAVIARNAICRPSAGQTAAWELVMSG